MLLISYTNLFVLEILVIEARGEQGGVAKVVERWGEPDTAKCVLAASIDDSKHDPVGFLYAFLDFSY